MKLKDIFFPKEGKPFRIFGLRAVSIGNCGRLCTKAGKKQAVIILIILLIVLLTPVRMNLKDGGSVSYRSLLYEITKIHKLSHDTEGVKPYIDGYEIKFLGMRVYRHTDDSLRERISDKVYVYEKGGFTLGDDKFYIKLNGDGSFEYYEGMLSSYIGRRDRCSWVLEDDILILTDKTSEYDKGKVYYFRVSGKSLVFQAEKSAEFIHIKVLDGEKFNEAASD